VLSFYFTVSSIVAAAWRLFLLAFSVRGEPAGRLFRHQACLLFTTYATLTSGRTACSILGLEFHVAQRHDRRDGTSCCSFVGYGASFLFRHAADADRAMTLWGWLERKR